MSLAEYRDSAFDFFSQIDSDTLLYIFNQFLPKRRAMF